LTNISLRVIICTVQILPEDVERRNCFAQQDTPPSKETNDGHGSTDQRHDDHHA
jgi:hypothetical protein